MANDQNQNKFEKDYDSMSREELLTNFYALTKKTPMKALQSISKAVKNGEDISITNALFGDSKKGVKIKKVGQFGKLFKRKDENNELILKENEVAIEKVNEAKACFGAYIKRLAKENKNLFPNFTIDEQNTKESSNRSFSSFIRNVFKYKNQKITCSNKQVKKDFFNNFFKNKESVNEYQLAETKDIIKIREKQLNQNIQLMKNIKVFKKPQSKIEIVSNMLKIQTEKNLKMEAMQIDGMKEQLKIQEEMQRMQEETQKMQEETQKIIQQVDAQIARGKVELQKDVNKLKMGAKKHPKQKEFWDGLQQLIDKDFNASAQERQEMDKKFKQAQEEIKKESQIKIGQINGMMMPYYDKSIDAELKQLQEEINREEKSKKGNDIANQKQMLTNLNEATMSADALTPRNSQKIGSRQQ